MNNKTFDILFFVGSKINKVKSCPYGQYTKDDVLRMLKEIENKITELAQKDKQISKE